ncbi:MAG: TIGR01777 family oxidoreductase [Phycisphaeraceae bacterium]|nr:TIGR01777 family oxidoreductase [Phycisphaeraceae bacterium]
MARRVVIAGGSGFLGTALAAHLAARGDAVVVLSRTPPKARPGLTHAHWDARSLGAWRTSIDGADALVNLTGRSVDCIKTPDHRDEILRSRVESTLVLGEAIRAASRPPRVWVQMSTAHAYGDPPEAVCDESSAFGEGLAPFIAREWESALDRASEGIPEMRRVVVRTSFVIDRAGGALPRLERVVRMGLGGRVGHGRQGMSWLHIADMNAIFLRAIDNDQMSGAYIASSPHPVSQSEFMRQLRRSLRVPIGLPAPAWLVRFGAPVLMRTDPDLAIYGRYVRPRRLLEEGFAFQFPTLIPALQNLYSPSSQPEHTRA